LYDLKGNEVRSLDDFKSFFKVFRQSFPDVKITIEDTVAEGDKVVVRCPVKATHAGEGIGLTPTNKPVNFTGMLMVRVKDGKIAEGWNSFDLLTMLNQVGAVNLTEK
jgi:predicted ester cyclase